MRLILFLAASLALAGCDGAADSGDAEQPAEAATPTEGVDRSKAGQPVTEAALSDADGESASLASAAGEPLLVNLWATWCAPCVAELPTLQALGEREGGPRVIAVSQDMAPRGSVDAFLEQHRLGELEVWHDPDMSLSGALGVQVLPTTILYDAQGREVWRYTGDLDWTGEEAARLLAEARGAGTR